MFYQTTVTLTISRMNALIDLLDNIENQAKAKSMSDMDILNLRLTPDMLPLSKQIQILSDNAKGMASRLTWKEIPKMEDNESTISEFKNRLEKTISYLKTFKEEDFVNSATSEARFSYFPGKHMVWADYIIGYGIPNFFFHVVTAYDILRHHGFDIGKKIILVKKYHY